MIYENRQYFVSSFVLHPKLIVATFFVFSLNTIGQTVVYNPSKTLEITVSKTYYNTEYIYIQNIGNQSIELEFELIEENFPSEWSITGCTNAICYNNIPDKGSLGVLQSNEEGYISLNISMNNQIGTGIIVFVVREELNSTVSDTVKFIITAEDNSQISVQPWVNIKYNQNGLTAFISSTSEAELYLFTISGNLIFMQKLGNVTTIPFSGIQSGIYVVLIRSKEGKEYIQKISI